MTKPATYTVLKSTVQVGIVKAVNFAQAVARAHGRYGICDVELSSERVPFAKERLQANTLQQAKQSRRYFVGDIDARVQALRDSLVA